jgi:hypothetical protein
MTDSDELAEAMFAASINPKLFEFALVAQLYAATVGKLITIEDAAVAVHTGQIVAQERIAEDGEVRYEVTASEEWKAS